MKNNKTQIIPLGQNCIPRTILTRWKVKPKKIWGEKTYPFDLAVFGMPEVTKCLKTDFSEFFDNLEYSQNGWIKAPNCIFFTHDTRYKEKDKEKFIECYTKRINNFREVIKTSENVLFVQVLGEDEDVENQYNELKKLRGTLPFKFAIVDTQNIVENINMNNVFVLKCPFPNEEYKQNWWKKEYYNSPTGKEFEKQIVDFCLQLLKS